MVTCEVRISLCGTTDEIEGARAALSARLPGLRGSAETPGKVVVIIQAADSAAAVRAVAARIDSLPPSVMDRVRLEGTAPTA
jgi:hypothetical protein